MYIQLVTVHCVTSKLITQSKPTTTQRSSLHRSRPAQHRYATAYSGSVEDDISAIPRGAEMGHYPHVHASTRRPNRALHGDPRTAHMASAPGVAINWASCSCPAYKYSRTSKDPKFRGSICEWYILYILYCFLILLSLQLDMLDTHRTCTWTKFRIVLSSLLVWGSRSQPYGGIWSAEVIVWRRYVAYSILFEREPNATVDIENRSWTERGLSCTVYVPHWHQLHTRSTRLCWRKLLRSPHNVSL